MTKAEHIKNIKADIRKVLKSHNLTIQYDDNLELIVTTKDKQLEDDDYIYFPLSDLRRR